MSMTREKAIEILESGSWSGYDDEEITEAVQMGADALKEQRPHGEWIDWGLMAEGHSHHVFNCSECDSHIFRVPSDLPNFCEFCGSDNRKRGDRNE